MRGVLAASAGLLLAAHAPASAQREVEIVGLDYAFEVPSELPPGRTLFRFVNKGKVRHEFNIVLLAPGVPVERFLAAAGSDTTPRATIDAMIEATIGVLFAKPGTRSAAALSTELLPGRTYAVRCVLKDAPNAPPHQALGMYSMIRVANAKPAASTPVRADTITGMDYAYRYPESLRPGTHDIAFVNAGAHRHEMVLSLMKQGVTLHELLERVKSGGNPSALLDDSFGVLHSPASTKPAGLLHVTLLPGREYLIVCTFKDAENAPPHVALGMVGTIRVPGNRVGE